MNKKMIMMAIAVVGFVGVISARHLPLNGEDSCAFHNKFLPNVRPDLDIALREANRAYNHTPENIRADYLMDSEYRKEEKSRERQLECDCRKEKNKFLSKIFGEPSVCVEYAFQKERNKRLDKELDKLFEQDRNTEACKEYKKQYSRARTQFHHYQTYGHHQYLKDKDNWTDRFYE